MAKNLFISIAILISVVYVLSAPADNDAPIPEEINAEVDTVDVESTEPKKTTKRGIYSGYGGFGYGYHYPHYSYSFLPYYGSYGHGYGYYPYSLGYHHGYGYGHYW
ncbi:uncharacterized protein LOC143204615 [Rhynchophorus ferrugineus]|uniref:uncharacterized protein LOC143204615 n=1 Tax=Rhynchophorus ferrugineus TaxID=354439 RepID=UPI003FCE6D62